MIEEALSAGGFVAVGRELPGGARGGWRWGDPIEVRAAAAVYGRGRDADRPLLIGSVKTNIGHLERRRESPASSRSCWPCATGRFRRTCISKRLTRTWSGIGCRCGWYRKRPTGARSCPPAAGRRQRIRNFGVNAHVVVEGYGASEDASVSDAERRLPAGSAQTVVVSLPESVAESPTEEGSCPRRTRLLPLSAKSGDALRELAERYISWLDERAGALSTEGAAESVLSDMTWDGGCGEEPFRAPRGCGVRGRRVVAGWIEGARGAGGGSEPQTATKVAFAYAGGAATGSEWARNSMRASRWCGRFSTGCEEVLGEVRGASLLDVMFGRSGSAGDLDDPAWTQPAVFALECALTALWSSIGIRPGVVFGTGSGEIAAAHAAGVFTLEEGCVSRARRGALMEALSGDRRSGYGVGRSGNGPERGHHSVAFAYTGESGDGPGGFFRRDVGRGVLGVARRASRWRSRAALERWRRWMSMWSSRSVRMRSWGQW